MLGATVCAAPPQIDLKTENKTLEAAVDRISEQVDYWFDRGDFPRVVAALKALYELDTKDEESLENLGWMLENMEKHDEALAYYVRFRKEHPEVRDAPYYEANFYFKKKLYARIPALLEPILERKPHPNVYRVLAHSYEKMGQLENSLRVWEAYIGVHPEDGQAKVNRDRVKGKLGKKN